MIKVNSSGETERKQEKKYKVIELVPLVYSVIQQIITS